MLQIRIGRGQKNLSPHNEEASNNPSMDWTEQHSSSKLWAFQICAVFCLQNPSQEYCLLFQLRAHNLEFFYHVYQTGQPLSGLVCMWKGNSHTVQEPNSEFVLFIMKLGLEKTKVELVFWLIFRNQGISQSRILHWIFCSHQVFTAIILMQNSLILYLALSPKVNY